MYIHDLVNITSRAWALPILAQMHAGVPGRQAPLLHATGASRTAFAQSMQHLIGLGHVERNPGYGHPLRPEFRLTAQGKKFATLAHKVQQASPGPSQTLLRKSWTLPLLVSLREPRRFNDIQRDLQSITDRALSQSLRRLEDHQWIKRTVDDAARPPRPLYAPINAGAVISAITAQTVHRLH
jgi:DNA-binding HxlR family transcriptional regulator